MPLEFLAGTTTPRFPVSAGPPELPQARRRVAGGLREALVAVVMLTGTAAAQTPAPDGGALFRQYCANCHSGSVDRAPDLTALRQMTAQRILRALEFGTMISMTHGRTGAERRAMAEFASGKPLDTTLTIAPAAAAMCTTRAAFALDAAAPSWQSFGQNQSNTRFQDARGAGIAAADVPKLKLAWAFGLPGDVQSYAALTMSGGRLFFGSIAGNVYSIDARTGCIHWAFDAGVSVRAAVNVGPVPGAAGRYAAYVGDARGNAYALDASTGQVLWKVSVDDFPSARITGSPVLHRGRLYVPMSSAEEGTGSLPDYECCKFRGSVTALDAATGKQLWKTYTVPEVPQPVRRNAQGTQLYGPSGVAIWSSPAIDEVRNALYVTTGNNYSDPPTFTSDAFMAMDLDSGKVLWTHQVTPQDAYVSACRLTDKTNCPTVNGPDFDFSASPILVTLAPGRRALVAGHKSGNVYAVDPDRRGERLWERRIGLGGTMGGVQWGSAADGTNLYVALSDIGRVMLPHTQFTDADPKRGGGMFALRLSDGTQVWHTPAISCDGRPRCSPAQSGAVSAIPGVAFSGSIDGHVRAYAADTGRVVWDFDTVREYQTVNGVPARGGSLDGPGPIIGGGMVYVNSGYTVDGGMAGNVILAFSVDGK